MMTLRDAPRFTMRELLFAAAALVAAILGMSRSMLK
jgi:hypothetical protein